VAADFLRQYLHNQGLGEWNRVNGRRPGGSRTHAWVQREGVVADITADQFADRPAVFVDYLDDWYMGMLDVQDGNAVDITYWNSEQKAAYDAVVRRVG